MCERHYWNTDMGRFDEAYYIAWLSPCSENLTDHGLYVMVKMVLHGSCVCYFAIPSMCDVKNGYFHHMCYSQVYYAKGIHTHMLHLYSLPKGSDLLMF